MSITLADVQAWRDAVNGRLDVAESADPGTDPIAHRLDEYRACLAELDAWIARFDDTGDRFVTYDSQPTLWADPYRTGRTAT